MSTLDRCRSEDYVSSHKYPALMHRCRGGVGGATVFFLNCHYFGFTSRCVVRKFLPEFLCMSPLSVMPCWEKSKRHDSYPHGQFPLRGLARLHEFPSILCTSCYLQVCTSMMLQLCRCTDFRCFAYSNPYQLIQSTLSICNIMTIQRKVKAALLCLLVPIVWYGLSLGL